MAELVDALASGASVRMDVEVRVLFWAPIFFQTRSLVCRSGEMLLRGFLRVGWLPHRGYSRDNWPTGWRATRGAWLFRS